MMEKDNQLLDERDEKLALQILADSDGGKVIVKTLKEDIAGRVTQLATMYRDAEHVDLLRVCAALSSSLSLYQALTRAESHVKQIDEIIDETPLD